MQLFFTCAQKRKYTRHPGGEFSQSTDRFTKWAGNVFQSRVL